MADASDPSIAPARPLAVAAATIGAVATVVSAAGSWIPSLWGDEAASVLSASRPLDSLAAMLQHVDAVHGAYYVFLHLVVNVAGSDPFVVRVPSALAVGVCAALVTWLCGRHGSLRFAVLAGLLAATLPRLTYAGEEARAYAFSAAAAAAVAVILDALARRPGGRLWWAYAAALTAGIYSFLYLALLGVALAAVVVLTPALRRQWRAFTAATAGAFLAASPLAVLAIAQRGQVAFLAHRDVTNAHAVLVDMWFGRGWYAAIAWTLILVAVVGMVLDLAARRKPRHGVRLEVLLLAWSVIPMGVLLIVSPVIAGYTARYGTFAAPAAAALIALGVRRLAHVRVLAVAAVTAVAVAVAPVWVLQRGPFAKNESDWNAIAATVDAYALPGDAIVFDEGVRPSRRPRLAMSTDPAAFAGLRDVTLGTPYAAGVSWHDETLSIPSAAAAGRMDGVSRLWLVEYAIGGRVSTWGMSDLASLGYTPAGRIENHRSVVYLYIRPAAAAQSATPWPVL